MRGILQVLSWGADVMRWLYSTAQRCPDQQTLVVEAFAAWVRLGLLYEQELPHTEVHGLLSLTFQALLHSSDGEPFSCLGVRDHFSWVLAACASLLTDSEGYERNSGGMYLLTQDPKALSVTTLLGGGLTSQSA